MVEMMIIDNANNTRSKVRQVTDIITDADADIDTTTTNTTTTTGEVNPGKLIVIGTEGEGKEENGT